MDPRRTQRVSEALREELGELIAFEMSDPRVESVDVPDVAVTPHGTHARVKVGVEGDDKTRQAALAALDHARHYLRHELAVRLDLRRVPELHFAADLWTEAEQRVDLLLKRAKRTRGKPAPQETPEPVK